MILLPTSIPRVSELQGFYQEPLTFLAEARSAFGNIFVLREGAPLFSRSPECAGAIALFGPAYHQALLTNTDLFGMLISGQGIPPGSAAEWRSIYEEAGCRLVHISEDKLTTRFIHILRL
jgi:hypothetical protein